MTTLLHGDCLELMNQIPDGSVDMVCADPPYGTTACKWDSVIPLEPMWAHLKRVTKKNGAIVMTASQPFTTALIASNIKNFKHEWIWHKEKGSNIASMKYQPAKVHEHILVFGYASVKYFPQMEKRLERNKRNNSPRINKVGVHGDKPFFVKKSRGSDSVKYPTSVKKYNSVRGGLHPTQKPVALMEYLIKTYTNEGDTVMDFTMGSGTTGVACKRLGRKFIGIEKDDKYFQIAKNRIESELL